MNRQLLAPFLVFALLVAANSACFAAQADRIVQAIDAAHILPTGTQLNVRVDKGKVFIVTKRHVNATDDDCKIDAALMAKQIMDVDSKNISSVSVSFEDAFPSNEYCQVVVTAFDIKNYGAGRLDRSQLLHSIVLLPCFKNNPAESLKQKTYQQIIDEPWVLPGDLSLERKQAFKRIADLQKVGFNQDLVKSDYVELFRIEDFLRQNNRQDAQRCLASLINVLQLQEGKTAQGDLK